MSLELIEAGIDSLIAVLSSFAMAARNKRSLDRIQYKIESLAYILGEKAKNDVAVLLQQLVLSAVPPTPLPAAATPAS